MKSKNSWPLFFWGIGFLIIMTSPQTPDPGLMMFGGILVAAISVIWMFREKKRREDSEE